MNIQKRELQISQAKPVFLWLVVIMTFVSDCAGQWITIDTKSYRSPSGEYELFVDPSDESGRGPGTYRLMKEEVVVWSGEKPMTLRDARVLDDGRVFGYTYEGGIWDTLRHGMRYTDLAVIMIDSKGEIRLRDPASDQESGQFTPNWAGSNCPKVSSMWIDVEHDRFTVQVTVTRNVHRLAWWTYRLATGEKLGDVYPAQPLGVFEAVSVQPVPGTQLTLMHWCVRQTNGAVLYLVDENGEAIWTYEIRGEYEGLGEDWGWSTINQKEFIQAEVSLLAFSFRSFRESARLKFELRVDPDAESGWKIEEVARESGVIPRSTPKENGEENKR